MLYEQRLFARLKFLDLLRDLHGSAFEDFFHRLMSSRYADFLDVRTHGNLGDEGADGLSLRGRKLYACYAPQKLVPAQVRRKLDSDLEKAVSKRRGQFDTFVFVHNDPHGMHPKVGSLLSEAASAHPNLAFEQMGVRKLWHVCMGLDLETVEDVLGCPIPIGQLVDGVGLEDLAPLLAHLRELRATADPLMALPDVQPDKLDFNHIQAEMREDLVRGMRHSHLVDVFYDGALRTAEHDEVAQGFRLYYDQIRRDRTSDPEDILMQLEMYILGNRRQPYRVHLAAWVVLAHFFERCDIFDSPPPGWRPGVESAT
ncbi:ABC-three component system protein [Streptomyces sp. SM12]|uniref:ABC-three component system protein n=1 Tax=Streptomyces sp. SM12 TaxID=1071602 RepID=UPI0027E4D7B3|nr:ABC-three component system protein [Streptomyces sp. SM12]